MPNLVATGQRIHIAHQLVRLAHIAPHDPQQGRIYHAALGKFHDRKIEAFFINAGRIGPEPAPADIDDMSGTGEEPYQRAVVERGCDHGDVVQMPGAFPWIIGDVDVAFKDVVAPDPADEVRHRIGHRVHMSGRACHGLCQHLTVGVIDPCGQIPGFADGR